MKGEPPCPGPPGISIDEPSSAAPGCRWRCRGSKPCRRADPPAQRPKRFCAFFFGNGVALPDQQSCRTYQDWHWFPHTDGPDYRLTRSLEPLEPHRHDMTIFGGLSHPTSRQLVGHNTVDVWLTGADIRVNLQNSISIDQVIARQYAAHTRIPSLVLSSQGGVGTKSRSTTISFDAQGRAIPAESMPRRVFERLFEPPPRGDLAARERALASGRRRVDFLLEDSRSLRNNLGRPDQQRLDEFLQSLSEVESRLARCARLARPGAAAGRSRGDQPRRLAARTDRLHPHHARPDRPGVRDRHDARRRLPDVRRGRRRHLRPLSRDPRHRPRRTSRPQPRQQQPRHLGPLRPLPRRTVRLLPGPPRRRSAKGKTRLLDNTMALYGSGTSTTHNARNYPTILAGGQNLGLRHGRFIKQQTERPLGDLYRHDAPPLRHPGPLVRRQRRGVFRNPRRGMKWGAIG